MLKNSQSYLPHPINPAANVATSARIPVRTCPTDDKGADDAMLILDSDWKFGLYSGSKNLSRTVSRSPYLSSSSIITPFVQPNPSWISYSPPPP